MLIISQRTAGLFCQRLWCLHAHRARAIGKDPRRIIRYAVIDAYLRLPGAARKRTFHVRQILRTCAELGLLIGAMRAPERTVKCGTALGDALCKGIVQMRRRGKVLHIHKDSERGANREHHNDGDPDPAQTSLLFFCGVRHVKIVLIV